MRSHGLCESQTNHMQRMRDSDLRIQAAEPSWMELIEGDDHRLTRAACRLVDQRRDGYLILPWNDTRHLLGAFGPSLKTGSTSMAELIQATKAYYSSVEGFLTRDPHRERTASTCMVSMSLARRMWRHSDEWTLGGVVWESGGAPSCH